VSRLRALLPPELSKVIGPVWIKYLARNPANSMIICEQWSGIRFRGGAAAARVTVAQRAGAET
jgi:hypothetical protein